MKTSNIIITAFVAFVVFGIFYAAFAMRKRYNEIDFSDPYYGYTKIEIQNTKNVNLVNELKHSTGYYSQEKGRILRGDTPALYVRDTVNYVVFSTDSILDITQYGSGDVVII